MDPDWVDRRGLYWVNGLALIEAQIQNTKPGYEAQNAGRACLQSMIHLEELFFQLFCFCNSGYAFSYWPLGKPYVPLLRKTVAPLFHYLNHRQESRSEKYLAIQSQRDLQKVSMSLANCRKMLKYWTFWRKKRIPRCDTFALWAHSAFCPTLLV